MERYWGESSQNVYYHNILIDIDGNLVLSADESDLENPMQDVYAHTIEMQIGDKKLKNYKNLSKRTFGN